MIFTLRLLVFSFFIILGFRISVRSIKGRTFTSLIYGFVLIFYTFLIRVRFIVDVSADDCGHTSVTISTGEKIWQLLRAIFGMQPNGNLAGNYREAFVLNCLLFVPLGYLCLLWMICGSSSLSYAVNDKSTSVATTEGRGESESRTLANTVLKSILICVATSLLIEITQ